MHPITLANATASARTAFVEIATATPTVAADIIMAYVAQSARVREIMTQWQEGVITHEECCRKMAQDMRVLG